MKTDGMRMFRLDCECGCDSGLVFRADGEDVFVSAVVSKFYAGQNPIRSAISETLRLAFGKRKNRWIVGIVTNEDALRNLAEFLKANCPLEYGSEENSSRLRFEDDAELNLCFVDLMCDMPRTKVLAGKAFRCSEIVLKRRGTEALVRRIERTLERPTTRFGNEKKRKSSATGRRKRRNTGTSFPSHRA